MTLMASSVRNMLFSERTSMHMLKHTRWADLAKSDGQLQCRYSLSNARGERQDLLRTPKTDRPWTALVRCGSGRGPQLVLP